MPRPSVHIASTHRPFDTRVFHRTCRSLAEAGHPVTLIVPHTHDETVEGIRIRAVPLPPTGKARLTTTLGQLYRAALEEDPHAIFHFHDAELLPYMLRLKATGRTVVYDMHEDTPLQVLYQHWIPRPLRRPVALAMRLLEWIGSHVFDGIIAAEPVIADRFRHARPVTVHNYPLRDELVVEAPAFRDRPPHAVYVGTMTRVRGIVEVVEALGRLPGDAPIRLVLGGSFHPSTLRDEVEALPGWRRVDFRGWMSRPQMAAALAEARAGIVTFHPVRRYLGNYPTKLFEYMAAGLPVVVSDFDQLRPFVEESQCGLLVDPLDPQAIADAVAWLVAHPDEAEAMGRRGQEAIRTRYNWEREARKLRAFYQQLS